MHTATRLVDMSIETLKELVLASSEDGLDLDENFNHALWMVRFSAQTSK